MKILLPIIALLLTLPINASEPLLSKWDETNWKDGVAYSSHTESITGIDLEIWGVESKINHSKDNQQRLYFTPFLIRNGAPVATCNAKKIDDVENFVWKFGKQNIAMLRHCNLNSGVYVYSYTPASNQGANYIVSLLKQAKSSISVSDSDFTITLKSVGFTKSWNNFGGNAL